MFKRLLERIKLSSGQNYSFSAVCCSDLLGVLFYTDDSILPVWLLDVKLARGRQNKPFVVNPILVHLKAEKGKNRMGKIPFLHFCYLVFKLDYLMGDWCTSQLDYRFLASLASNDDDSRILVFLVPGDSIVFDNTID